MCPIKHVRPRYPHQLSYGVPARAAGDAGIVRCYLDIGHRVLALALGVVSANYAKSWGRFTRRMSFAFSAIPTLVILFWLHYPAQAVFNVVIDPFYTASLTFSLVNIFGVGEMVRQAVA